MAPHFNQHEPAGGTANGTKPSESVVEWYLPAPPASFPPTSTLTQHPHAQLGTARRRRGGDTGGWRSNGPPGEGKSDRPCKCRHEATRQRPEHRDEPLDQSRVIQRRCVQDDTYRRAHPDSIPRASRIPCHLCAHDAPLLGCVAIVGIRCAQRELRCLTAASGWVVTRHARSPSSWL